MKQIYVFQNPILHYKLEFIASSEEEARSRLHNPQDDLFVIPAQEYIFLSTKQCFHTQDTD